MDGARDFLEDVRHRQLTAGHLLGLWNIVIGRRIAKADGTVLSAGLTWRELAQVLKKLRWDREAVRELGLDPEELPPRDRVRFWYSAIAQAQVAGPTATRAGNQLVELLAKHGYVIGTAPGKQG
jgi:hypothetical protein